MGAGEPTRTAYARGNRNRSGRRRAARRRRRTGVRGAGEADLANVRLVCVAQAPDDQLVHALARHARRRSDSSDDAPISFAPSAARSRRTTALLAPLLNGTAPVDDDFTFTFPAGALRSSGHAPRSSRSTSRTCCSASPSAPPSTTGRSGVAESIARVVAGDGQHFAALSVLDGGPPVPTDLAARPRHRGRRQPALPVPLQLGDADDPHDPVCAASGVALLLALALLTALHHQRDAPSRAAQRRR